MIAKYDHQNNHILIPKNGNAPMLFLEYLRDNSVNNLIIDRLQIMQERRVKYDDYLRISIHNKNKYQHLDLIDYINVNL